MDIRWARRAMVWGLMLLVAACAANGEIVTVNDPFSGPKREFTRYLDIHYLKGIGMAESQGQFAVRATFTEEGRLPHVGQVGDLGQFKLGNDILTLPASTEVLPTYQVAGNGVWSRYSVVYKLTPEQAAQFSQAALTAVKVAVGDASFLLAPDEDDAQVIRANAAILVGAPAGK